MRLLVVEKLIGVIVVVDDVLIIAVNVLIGVDVLIIVALVVAVSQMK